MFSQKYTQQEKAMYKNKYGNFAEAKLTDLYIEMTSEEEEIFNKYGAEAFTIIDDECVVNPNYEQEQAEKRMQDFYNNFIITSWGAFRKTPKGYSSAVEAVNTIFNMVNVSQSFTDQLANLLIFYEVPDFNDENQCTEEWLVSHQKTHEACDLQTFMQWYLEFQTVWASTQYTDIPVPQMEL